MIFTRRTIKNECSFSGRGLHSGEAVEVRIFPASDGIQFQVGSDVVAANPDNVTNTDRCTVLGNVRTVEHLMSAFAATGITDARVELTYPELPGLDGSAKEYWQELSAAEKEEIGSRELNDPYTRLYIHDKDVKIAVAKGTGHWRYEFVTENRWPGEQIFESLDIISQYGTEVAPARTMVFHDEVEMAKAAGLGQGLDETSVVIIDEAGYGNVTRFDNEPARHKLLDLIGDLYLAGFPIDHLNVVGARCGHRHNVEMAKRLFEATQIL